MPMPSKGKAHLMSVSSMAMLNGLAHNVLAALLLGPEKQHKWSIFSYFSAAQHRDLNLNGLLLFTERTTFVRLSFVLDKQAE